MHALRRRQLLPALALLPLCAGLPLRAQPADSSSATAPAPAPVQANSATPGTSMDVPTRPGATVKIYWATVPRPLGTLLLLPGGDGWYGHVVDGMPGGSNFLVRSTPAFLASGFNVAIFGESSDVDGLSYEERVTAQHAADVNAVIDHVLTLSPAPLWLVGTSRGTISATVATIARQTPGITGLVLTSSITLPGHIGTIQEQALGAIRVPVLVIHHARDACSVCPVSEVGRIEQRLVNAPVRKTMIVDGGGHPRGRTCGALHWHGYIGMEQQVVDTITAWISHPVPSSQLQSG